MVFVTFYLIRKEYISGIVVGWGKTVILLSADRAASDPIAISTWWAVVGNDVVCLIAGAVSRRSLRTHPRFVHGQDGRKPFRSRITLFAFRESRTARAAETPVSEAAGLEVMSTAV